MTAEPKKRTLEEVEAEAQEILRQVEQYNRDGNYAAAYAAGLDSAGLMREWVDRMNEEKGRGGPSKNTENPGAFQAETAENPEEI